ncbi:MAG: hypothetical protein WCJ64_14545 [Rhodospirillaceae bacterium]
MTKRRPSTADNPGAASPLVIRMVPLTVPEIRLLHCAARTCAQELTDDAVGLAEATGYVIDVDLDALRNRLGNALDVIEGKFGRAA